MPDFDRLTIVERSRRRRLKRKIRFRRAGLGALLGALIASFVLGSSVFGLGVKPLGMESVSGMVSVEQSQPTTVESSTEEMNNISNTSGVSEEPINILALGVDRRPDGSSEELGVRSDTIMVLRVYPRSGDIRMLSLPRDLFMEIAPGEEDRINVAYSEGGVEQTRAVVERYTGLEIDNYALIDFAGFEQTVDALDGLKVKVREGEYPPETRLEPGKKKLDGEQALAYARYRYSDGGDLDRIRQQQQIIASAKAKVLSLGTVTKLPELLGVAEENVQTDVGLRDAFSLVRALAGKEDRGGVKSFQLEGEPTTLDDGRQVLIPKDDENQRIISEFVQ